MAFAEIHFHLLPGLDDGPATLDEAVELAAAAAAEGTRAIFATPHINSYWDVDVATLPERVEEVSAALRDARVPVEVVCGGELAHHGAGRLSQRELEIIAGGPPGRRWLLLEAPLNGLDPTFTAAAGELRARGFAVVVAHPERALKGREESWGIIEHELDAGSVMQVNAWSVAGLNGESARRDAFRVLGAAPSAAIASDAHGGKRMPALRMALDELESAGEHSSLRRVDAVPRALLERGLPPSDALAA